ncbi:alkaline shock response membrane anchor protein AmaP [Jannaschia sp. R86511]|uniref:alkaline shock response membrane anchor protein AmaP n=1 Tax=Jannaschia sp. R86511 TaxID=3093853 RepID=UPI0036D25446
MSTTMSSRPGRLNRTLLALLGAVLLLSGAAVLALATGALSGVLPGLAPPDQPVLPEAALGYLLEQPWVPVAVAALGVLVALLGLRWLLAQLPRRSGTGRIGLGGEPGRGVTRLDASTVADAVEHDVEGYAGVRSAHAAVSGGRSQTTLTLSLVVDPGTDLRALTERVRDHAQARLARALGVDEVRGRLLVTTGRGGGSTTVA